MPPSRVTRSAARNAAASSSSGPPGDTTANGIASTSAFPPTNQNPPKTLRKRKVQEESAPDSSLPAQPPSKRAKVASKPNRQRKGKGIPAPPPDEMDQDPVEPSSLPQPQSAASKRRSKRNKKPVTTDVSPSASNKKPDRRIAQGQEDVDMDDANDPAKPPEEDVDDDDDMGDRGDEDGDRYPEDYERDDDDDEDDVFDGSYLAGAGGPGELSNTLRALSGLVSGMTSRFRNILENLKQEDPSLQMVALQELSELLLVSTEDNLTGHFTPDAFVKELVVLMQGGGPFGENVEMMLLACRCLANMMEALPQSTANVVYGGAVPVLCAKLMEIHYIDVAEQALSTLEKISMEYPLAIVKEGGLTACLTYLDFFPTHVQRSAVTTAANCCRAVPEDQFATVRDVMSILLNVLNSSDQKVVEQGCLCVTRLVESFRYSSEKLEQLMSKDMLRAILQLLLPGTTNVVGSHIHTQFLKVLGIVAKASPTLSVDMLKMNIVETLYQILTGVSPPVGQDASSTNDTVMIMQALIHKPREQITETLNVICELLPGYSSRLASEIGEGKKAKDESKEGPDALRRRLFNSCKPELRQFAMTLLPTLTDAYTSTVNFLVRQKVLTAQLKMISNLDADILLEALSTMSFASHLATILSQQDHPSLVMYGLYAADLLMKRLPDTYRYNFYREGVVSEIEKLAEARKEPPQVPQLPKEAEVVNEDGVEESGDSDDHLDDHLDSSRSSSQSSAIVANTNVVAAYRAELAATPNEEARKFLEAHEKDGTSDMKIKAQKNMQSLKALAEGLLNEDDPELTFVKLAKYFDSSDSLQSISSFELLNSGILSSLLAVLGDNDTEGINEDTRRSFLKAFISGNDGDAPFSVLVKKLQDLLSRSEHFEVVTVHQGYDGSRSSASMLAKQIRLKLVADDESDIPKSFRNIMVSIHAIATFKALEDYLRPRIMMSERPRVGRREARAGGLSSALAAFAAAAGLPSPGASGFLPPGSGPPNDAAAPPPSGSNPKPSKPRARATRSNKGGPMAEPGSSSNSALREPLQERPDTSAEETLECVDEQRLQDEDEMDDMDAVLDDIERDMDDEPEQDADAVNMEVANSGKVTARKEDGTRIATPVGGNGTPQPSTASTPQPASRMNYAAAASSPLRDWHIEFELNGQRIGNNTTVYKAVQSKRTGSDEFAARNVWSVVHPIKFSRVPGPPPSDGSLSPGAVHSAPIVSLPASLEKNKVSTSVLQLLGILHALNANIDDVFADVEESKPQSQALSQFVNTKLTAKLNRQLEEPLIVASCCLPGWSEDLARFCPFLFPFETRHLFLQSTSFGYSRSMSRWQSTQQNENGRQDRHRDDSRPFLGRLQRQKVRISRERILESAIKVMEIYGASPSILEVEYFEEVGTGLGPTLEFYSSVSRAFTEKKLKLWRENESEDSSEYAFGKQGLFPAPLSAEAAESENGKKVLHLYKILGKFVARSMLDSRIIDIFFNATFFRMGDNVDRAVPLSLGAVNSVDKGLARSLSLLRKFVLAKKAIDEDGRLGAAEKANRIQDVTINDVHVEDLALDFTLPGYPDIELLPGGSDMSVTIYNVDQYVDKVVDLTLGSGVQRQVEAFRIGFSQVFPYTALRSFTPDELVMLFGQVEEDWTLETLMDSMKADHGFNMDSKSIRNLLQTMGSYSPAERREFLQFVTGSPKLPIGGFKALTPLFTVVCKPSEPPYTSDDYLPSVMTCVNYLKLPDYSTHKVLQERLGVAVREGQGAFHLS